MSSGAPVSDQWFYVLEERQIGPVGRDQLIRLVERGIVQSDTFVWREGLQDWVEARRVKFLPFQVASAASPVKVAVAAAVVDEDDSDEDEEEEEDPRPKKKKKKREMEYASLWNRFVALFVDALIVWVICFGFWFFIGFSMGINGIDVAQYEKEINIASYFVWCVVYILYFSIMESSDTQASLGKMAIGIKVVDQDGDRLGFLQSLGRATGRFFCNMILGFGLLVAAFTEKKQGLHDLMAGTLVVKS